MTELSAAKLAELRDIAEAARDEWASKVPTRTLRQFHEATYPTTVIALLDLIAEQQAELAEFREWEAEKQYRAIIGRPWSFLDRNAPKGVPIFEATGPKNERVVHLQRPEETLEWVERWEERDVRLGPWLPAGGESND